MSREDEKEIKDALIEFDNMYPNTINMDNVNNIIEQIKQKRENNNTVGQIK